VLGADKKLGQRLWKWLLTDTGGVEYIRDGGVINGTPKNEESKLGKGLWLNSNKCLLDCNSFLKFTSGGNSR
jgi:hypothetical protein